MADLIPIKASELPLDNTLTNGDVILSVGDVLHRVDLARILESNGGGTVPTGKDGLISGSSEHIANYQYRFIANEYRIDGFYYDQPLSNVITFDAADPAHDRIDLVIIELVLAGPQISVIKGEATTPPSKPLLENPDNQIEFTFVTIKANTTSPDTINNILAYDENTGIAGGEFDALGSNSDIYLEDVSDPFSGVKAILMDSSAIETSVTLTPSAPLTNTDSTLIFKLKLLESLGTGYVFTLSIGTQTLYVKAGTYGYDNTNMLYQSIIIPLNKFSDAEITEIKITKKARSARLFIDQVKIQTGNDISTENGDYTLSGGSELTTQDVVNMIGGGTSVTIIQNTESVLNFNLSKEILANFGSPNANETYSIKVGTPIINSSNRVLINALNEPTITNATKLSGSNFVPNTDMYMVANYTGTARGYEYFFLNISDIGSDVEFRPLYDRLIENASVSGAYNISMTSGETWLLTISSATSIALTDLPATNKTKTITAHFLVGTHIPTFSAKLLEYKTGDFDLARVNTIVIEYVKSTFVKMQISQKD